MRDFVISTDNTADLPADYTKANDIDIHTLFYSMGGEIYGLDKNIPVEEFYQRMKDGEMPTTMAGNPQQIMKLFEKRVKEGYDILHISFSSALSSSYNNYCIAAEEVMENNPGCRIVVIDSLSASMGEGLVVYRAMQLKKEGKSMDEIVEYLNNHIKNFAQFFTVNDLNHLYRGGRISKTTAFIGSLAGIKPLIYINDKGELIPFGKIRGRKKSLLTLVEEVGKYMGSFKDETDKVFIGHSDALEEAQFVADKIKEQYGMDSIINYICPTIGAHTGPGTVAVFFMAEKRF